MNCESRIGLNSFKSTMKWKRVFTLAKLKKKRTKTPDTYAKGDGKMD